jgi:hypothetical protein
MPTLSDLTIANANEVVAHIIQVALTPIFLLSGIATLLNVFSSRLARVADRVEQLTKAIEEAGGEPTPAQSEQLADLHRRSVALDAAVILAAVGGGATCAAVLTLFLGAAGNATVATALFILFGLAVICALGAITAFTAEMLMAGTGIRARVAEGRRGGSEGLKAAAQ